MRLTFSTDYALRLLMLVGLEIDRLVTIEEVADRFGISKNHLMKVAYQLAQAGYLETVRGRNGGLRLAKAPSQIVVGAVVGEIEPDFAVVECENPGGYCRTVGYDSDHGYARHEFEEGEISFILSLQRKSLCLPPFHSITLGPQLSRSAWPAP